eukprot:4195510-Pyramimonas_sp.AAC.1
MNLCKRRPVGHGRPDADVHGRPLAQPLRRRAARKGRDNRGRAGQPRQQPRRCAGGGPKGV